MIAIFTTPAKGRCILNKTMLSKEILEYAQRTDLTEGLLPQHAPEVIVFENPEAIDEYASSQVIDLVRRKPDAVLTLPTGNTPIGMYETLVASYRQGEVDFSDVTAFNLDEYYPIGQSHPNSYAAYMRNNLISKINIGKWHIPNGEATSVFDEVIRYQTLLDATQPIDLAIVGLGPGTTCHLGFNERGSLIDSRVRYVTLDPQTTEVNRTLFTDPGEIPNGALTQGIADILQAERVLLIAKGEAKAWGINRTLKGPVSPSAPSSFLRLHPKVTFALDSAAASYI